jgi:hypothetical protein
MPEGPNEDRPQGYKLEWKIGFRFCGSNHAGQHTFALNSEVASAKSGADI